MKSKIFKYQIADEVQMPVGAEILSVQFQGEILCLWALVDQMIEVETRRFEVIGTGHQIDIDNLEYLTTVQQDPYVWHIFERF